MTSPVTRAGAVAAIGSLAVLAPFLGWGMAVLFGVIAVGALLLPREWSAFELLASPTDVEDARLNQLAGFALAVTALAILATVEAFGLSITVFSMVVLLLVGGNLAEELYRGRWRNELGAVLVFLAGGVLASLAAFAVMQSVLAIEVAFATSTAAFLAITGGLVAGLCRTDWSRRDDPAALLSAGLALWLLSSLSIQPTPTTVTLGIVVTGALGAAAYMTDTASVAGLITGVLLGFVTIVLAGFHWFVLLLAFFGIGGLSTKYRYEEKEQRGVAEDNQGARGSGNVLSNSTIAMVAVIGYAASPLVAGIGPLPFAIAFAGAMATALADTLSSEIGSLYDGTRLVTTLEQVEPGTDGGITLQGGIAGVAGAACIGILAIGLLPTIGLLGGVIVTIGGLWGMTTDSLLGATVEDRLMGNGWVNLLGTASGAAVSVILALALGLFLIP